MTNPENSETVGGLDANRTSEQSPDRSVSSRRFSTKQLLLAAFLSSLGTGTVALTGGALVLNSQKDRIVDAAVEGAENAANQELSERIELLQSQAEAMKATGFAIMAAGFNLISVAQDELSDPQEFTKFAAGVMSGAATDLWEFASGKGLDTDKLSTEFSKYVSGNEAINAAVETLTNLCVEIERQATEILTLEKQLEFTEEDIRQFGEEISKSLREEFTFAPQPESLESTDLPSSDEGMPE